MKTYDKSTYVVILILGVLATISALFIIFGRTNEMLLGSFVFIVAAVYLYIFLREASVIKVSAESLDIISFKLLTKNLSFKRDEIKEIELDYKFSGWETHSNEDAHIIVTTRSKTYKRRIFFNDNTMKSIYNDLKDNNYNVTWIEYEQGLKP